MKRCFIITGGMGDCGGSGAVVRVCVCACEHLRFGRERKFWLFRYWYC